jgi:hypothetical protein
MDPVAASGYAGTATLWRGGSSNMFTVLDRISLAGYADYPNEDAFGVSGPWAWVIDTSIFPGTPPAMHPQSDAAWLAGFATARLEALAPEADDGRDLVRRVMEEAREAFFAAASPERRDPVTWPLGAMTLVRAEPERLRVWTFGDTTAYVRRPDGSVETVGEASNLREFEAAKARELLDASGATPATITRTPEFREWLSGRRTRQKASGGPEILSLRPEAADRMRYQEAEAGPGTIVLLASDGLSALVDLYGHVDAAGLLEAALASGLAPLAQAARRIETEIDPSGMLYPRFKLSDDATGLLLKKK